MKDKERAMIGSKTLEPVDRVEITILVDNFIDNTLKSYSGVSRFRDRKIEETLLAEHGLSLWLDITRKETKHSFLLDTGPSQSGVIHNAREMGINLKKLKGVFLSHNHLDHTTGLESVLAVTGPIPVFIHPYGFYTKWVKSKPSTLDKGRLAKMGAIWQSEEGPQAITPFLLTSGPIPRMTEFEDIIGISDRKVEINGVMEEEAFLDDGALILSLKGKGLIIITGCAHSGIINTIEHCQKVGGNQKIYALIGGFHITQASPKRITKTVQVLKEKKIKHLVPLHCTGFEAMASIWHAFPKKFIIPSVGTRIEF